MFAPDEPIKIVDNLYLGNFTAANYDNLKKNDISSVVCLTSDSHEYSDDIELFHIHDISENLDAETFSLDKLESAVEFIEQQVAKNHNVIVHCMAGSSRSPTVIIAYVMKITGLTVNESCNFVKKKAGHINPTFMDLLDEYYYSIH